MAKIEKQQVNKIFAASAVLSKDVNDKIKTISLPDGSKANINLFAYNFPSSALCNAITGAGVITEELRKAHIEKLLSKFYENQNVSNKVNAALSSQVNSPVAKHKSSNQEEVRYL